MPNNNPSTSSAIADTIPGSTEYKPPLLTMFYPHKELRHQRDMRSFVNASLREPKMDLVVSLLSRPPMKNFMVQILNTRYTLKAGNGTNSFSFQKIAVPFVHLLVREEFKNSVHQTSLKTIFHTVFSYTNFFQNYGNNLKYLLEHPISLVDPHDTQMYESEFSTSLLSDVVFPFVETLQIGLEYVPGATKCPTFVDLLPILRQGCSHCKTECTAFEAHRRLTLNLSFLEDMIQNYVDNDRSPSEQQICSHDFKEDLPGDLSSQGPRHDNDFQHYRDIAIFPTPAETLCTRDPFLPRSADELEGTYHWLNSSTERFIDSHFRLLREDLTRSFRKGICQFLGQNASTGQNLLKHPEEVSHKFEVMGDQGVDGLVIVWQDVQVVSIVSNSWLGTSFELSVSQIFSDEQEEDRYASWTTGQGSKLLQVGSLVCIIFRDREQCNSLSTSDHASSSDESSILHSHEKSGVDGSFIGDNGTVIVFAKVVEDNRKNLSHNPVRFSLFVRPVADVSVSFLISRMGSVTNLTERCSGSAEMLQLLGHFITGTENVLNCLKSLELTSIPWYHQIFKSSSCTNESSPSIDGNDAIGAPPYIGISTTYDLSFLAETEEAAESLRSVPIGNIEIATAQLTENIGNIRLDKTQLEAFINGLFKEVCLIQGPPGCGKTYIGVQIVKAILLNERCESRSINFHHDLERPPILCVCFTNHALDQFLESLVNSNAVNIEDVVRIGNRSGSELLKERNLNSLSSPTKDEKRAHFRNRAEYEASGSAIDTLVAIIHGDTGGSKFGQWLKGKRISLYNNIMSRIEDDSIVSEVQEELFDDALLRWTELEESEIITQMRMEKLEEAREAFLQDIRVELEKCYLTARRTFLKLQESKNLAKLRTLRSARVVGCTTSGAASRQGILQALGARIIIGEEAAEACEGHILSTLSPKTEHLILIGDHLQLRPRVAEYDLTVDSNQGYNLDVSLFERLSQGNLVPIVKLSTQRRMHPEIADLARLSLYPFLNDADTVVNQGSPDGFNYPIYFWSHSHEEEDMNESVGRNRSHVNNHEVDLITGLTRYTIKQGYSPSNIAILTPYLGQLKRIRERFSAEEVSAMLTDKNIEEMALVGITIDVTTTSDHPNSISKNNEDGELVQTTMEDCVRLSTVDNFQGEEADIVLISMVRSNDDGKIGFLSSSNRTNVMLTRARKGMFLIGNSSTMLSAPEETLLHKVTKHLKTLERVCTVLPLKCQLHGKTNYVSHSDGFSRDGGCGDPCDKTLPCGHLCTRRCHPDDIKHENQKCEVQCTKVLTRCQHVCQRKCHEPCGSCTIPKSLLLSCGHTIETTCGRSEEKDLKCRTIISTIEKPLCKHIVPLQCWEGGVSQAACQKICERLRECGHACLEVCHVQGSPTGDDLHKGDCESRCERLLPCGHVCNEVCHYDRECKPCTRRCEEGCAHQSCKEICSERCTRCSQKCAWTCSCGANRGICNESCRVPCLRSPCNRRCSLRLECGHSCPGVCGEACVPVSFCRECGLGTEVGGQIADVIGSRTLEELDEADGPIIVLECLHAFTLASLDRLFGMDAFYEREVDGWGTPRSVSDVLHAGMCGRGRTECPDCGTAIKDVRRYHRVIRLRNLGKETAVWENGMRRQIFVLKEDIGGLFNMIEREISESSRDSRKTKSRELRTANNLVLDKIHNNVQTVLRRVALMKQSISRENPWMICKEAVSDVVEKSTRTVRTGLAHVQLEVVGLKCRFTVFKTIRNGNVGGSRDKVMGRLQACFENAKQVWGSNVQTVRQANGENGVKRLAARYRRTLSQFMGDLGRLANVERRFHFAVRPLIDDCDRELNRIAPRTNAGPSRTAWTSGQSVGAMNGSQRQ